MIDRATFNRQIAILAEMHRHVLSAPTIDEYYALLSPRMTTEQFVRMARRLEMAGGFWPKPGEFLPPVHERASSEQLLAAAQREGLLPAGQSRAQLPARVS